MKAPTARAMSFGHAHRELETARRQGLTLAEWLSKADAAAQRLHEAMGRIGAHDRLAHAPDSREGFSPRYMVALPGGGTWEIGAVELSRIGIFSWFDEQARPQMAAYGLYSNVYFPGGINLLNGKWNLIDDDVDVNLRQILAVVGRAFPESVDA